MEKSRRGTDAVGTARLATNESDTTNFEKGEDPHQALSHGGAELEALKTNGA